MMSGPFVPCMSHRNTAWPPVDERANRINLRFPGRLDEVFGRADFLHDLIAIVPRLLWRN